MKPKYFEGLRAAQDQDERSGVDPMGPFDFQVLAAKTFGEKISAWLLRKLMPPAFALARRFFRSSSSTASTGSRARPM